MNSNVAIQNPGRVAFYGGTGTPIDIRRHTRFAWTFEVTAEIAADAVFQVLAAPASDADNCDPGALVPVPEVVICSNAVPAEQSLFTIPAGTPVGTLCAVTLPCRPNAFVQLAAVSGTTASLQAVITLSGPMI